MSTRQGLLSSFRLTSTVAWFFGAVAVFGSAPLAGAEEYANRIRPFLKTHCLDCHSTKAEKGGLDMELS